jgi:uncharacterized membrane protein
MKRAIVGVGASLIVVGLVMFAFTIVNLPHTVTEQYQIPKSSDLVNESFTVPAGTAQRSATLTEDDVVHIELQVTAGGNKDINFNVNNGTPVFMSDTRVTTVNKNWTVPFNGTFYFVYDNSFSWITSKDVTTRVTRYWNEIGYRDVVKYYPLLSFEFSYVGLVILLAGIGITILGTIRKGTSKPQPV